MERVVLTVNPAHGKYKKITFVLDNIVCELKLSWGKIFLIEIWAKSKGALKFMILGVNELEIGKMVSRLCPCFVVVIEMTFSVIFYKISLSVNHCCWII